jgi:hypothetical protein
MMKRFLLLSACLYPILCSAISNLSLNREKQVTVTSVPSFVTMTADLAKPGNRVEGGIFGDANQSGTFDLADRNWCWRWGCITDGIGWIVDKSNPTASIMGDETDVDGKLQVTFPILRQNIKLMPHGTIFIYMKDQDGTEAVGKINTDIQPSAPLIQGRITSAADGQPVVNAYIEAVSMVDPNNDGFRMAHTDANGDYFLMLDPDEWQISVWPNSADSRFKRPESVKITLSDNQIVTQDFALQSFDSFIEGNLKKSDGSPVVGLMMTAFPTDTYITNNGISDASGHYKIGSSPGNIRVRPATVNDNSYAWPAGYYETPYEPEITLAGGQTLTQDFTFEPYQEWIEGTCTIDSQPAANIRVSANYLSTQGNQFRNSDAFSDQSGVFHVGVLPGTVFRLEAFTMGYETIYPETHIYINIVVNNGDVITGKDFALALYQGENNISGKVMLADSSGYQNVYVVAADKSPYSASAFHFTYTDLNGHFTFQNLPYGDWRIGAYYKDATFTPPMQYYQTDDSTQITDANFLVTLPAGVSHAPQQLPKECVLWPNYPNPFNPATTFKFSLPRAQQVLLEIYNLQGQKVTTLIDDHFNAGSYQTTWNASDQSSGLYLCRFQAGQYSEMRKLLLVK